MPLADVLRAPRNPKKHAQTVISRSITKYGVVELPALDERTGRLVAGHGRLTDWQTRRAAGEEPPDGIRVGADGEWLVPVNRGWASRSDADADAYLLVSNQATIAGGWDDAQLGEMLAGLRDTDTDLLETAGFGDDELARLLAGHDSTGGGDGGGGGPAGPRPKLADRFGVPPFDVLDARQGYWRERKKHWLGVGINSEIGRAGALVYTSPTSADPDFYDQKTKVEQQLGRTLSTAEFQAEYYTPTTHNAGLLSGTSVFDPVLCELAYRWFSAPGAVVLDPFAGGSVRGVVAAALGRAYRGNDLAADQVEANRRQVADLIGDDADVIYTVGDSRQWVTTLAPGSVDMVMTCPPYYGLEKYSDDPGDLSTMGYVAFDAVYGEIIAGCAAALRDNRFAVFVVGDVRDKHGALHDLRGSTIRAAEAAGLALVNGAVFLTPVGNVAMRSGRQFAASRCLGRTHQDFLIFCKGDRKAAAAWCGDVEVDLPDQPAPDDPDAAEADLYAVEQGET